ncbi:PREDICTED: uncharacterized protein LOC108547277 [Eufriesea mexicana]|uniref:uncharacterized protein LOC108547277 n=1 Tax=Eufriesea mexicana TaxID=516756 RepID=UPI00083BA884|nr:PREDICTED: uncharacterized protein LOC108547277 [Eufriesea mexicana]
MPTHLQVIPCPQKQVIKRFIRDVPCPRVKSKKPREVCRTDESKRAWKQIDEAVCSSSKEVSQRVTCATKQQPTKCAPKTCPGKEGKSVSMGCPKCESNRIQKLECEVYQLRKEIECMKYERKEAEKAIQKAILRSARALGGRFKPTVPGSIEKLLDTCDSDASSQSTSSVTICAAESTLPAIHACQKRTSRRSEEFDYC